MLLFSILFPIILHAQTQNNCQGIAAFTYTVDSGTVNFTAIDTTAAGSVSLWSFGDGSTSTLPAPAHTYSTPGIYQVVHWVTDSLTKCYDSAVQSITISPSAGCTASILYIANSNNAGVYYFTDSIFGQVDTSWLWTVNDSVVSVFKTFAYAFIKPGTYHVCEQVQTITGCTAKTCQDVVTTNIDTCGLSPGFTYSKDSIDNGLLGYNFSNLSSGAGITSWHWNFGDSGVSSIVNPTHFFIQSGTYMVCETITNSSGCSATTCQNIWVSNPDSCGVSADFTVSRDSTNADQYHFTDMSAGPLISSWLWNFGDGTTSSVENPTHDFVAGGSYFVCESVQTSSGCTGQICRWLQITNMDTCFLNASFIYSVMQGQPNTISFKANIGQAVASEVWMIYKRSDSISSGAPLAVLDSANPTFVFTDTGVYLVTLKATTPSGCTDSISEPIIIDSLNAANASPNNVSPIQAFPNPANTNVSLTVPLSTNNNITLNIYNSSANLIVTKQVAGIAGANHITIPVQSLQSGAYYIQINYGNEIRLTRFQKL